MNPQMMPHMMAPNVRMPQGMMPHQPMMPHMMPQGQMIGPPRMGQPIRPQISTPANLNQVPPPNLNQVQPSNVPSVLSGMTLNGPRAGFIPLPMHAHGQPSPMQRQSTNSALAPPPGLSVPASNQIVRQHNGNPAPYGNLAPPPGLNSRTPVKPATSSPEPTNQARNNADLSAFGVRPNQSSTLGAPPGFASLPTSWVKGRPPSTDNSTATRVARSPPGLGPLVTLVVDSDRSTADDRIFQGKTFKEALESATDLGLDSPAIV